MGTIDDIKASFGEDFFAPRPDRQPLHVWHEVCVCGHLDRFHSPSVGGLYRLNPTSESNRGGVIYTISNPFDGCAGALGSKGYDKETVEIDRDAHTIVNRVNPTCPCDKFHPVVKADRPNRYFNQRMPADRTDPSRHPFMLGIRAFNTFLSGRKQAKTNPDWAAAEFDRRFIWLEGKRRCAISRCEQTDGVWPVFINDDRSELRCPKHR